MCGRYAMNKKVDDLIVDYVAGGGKVKNFVADWQATFSISSFQVRKDDGREGLPPRPTLSLVMAVARTDGRITTSRA